jgi:hypothetical protein
LILPNLIVKIQEVENRSRSGIREGGEEAGGQEYDGSVEEGGGIVEMTI